MIEDMETYKEHCANVADRMHDKEVRIRNVQRLNQRRSLGQPVSFTDAEEYQWAHCPFCGYKNINSVEPDLCEHFNGMTDVHFLFKNRYDDETI